MFEGRQYRISSAFLQLVERSVVSNRFSQGYDLGAYWTGSWVPQSSPGIKLYVSVTHGERLNQATAPGGYLYNGRLELFPLGSFEKHGDYVGGFKTFQPEPRISLGMAYTLNKDAYPLYGTQYSGRNNTDIESLFADYMFKYGNFSSLGEYAWRDVQNELLVSPAGERVLSSVTSGSGYFIQMGYLATQKVEIAARFERIHPKHEYEQLIIQREREDHYSAGATYFIHNHSLKLQVSVTLVDESGRELTDHFRYLESRVQLQLNF